MRSLVSTTTKKLLYGLLASISINAFALPGEIPAPEKTNSDWTRIVLPPDFSPISSLTNINNQLYAGTYSGNLYTYQTANYWLLRGNNRFDSSTIKSLMPFTKSINATCSTSNGNIYIGTEDGKVLQLDKIQHKWLELNTHNKFNAVIQLSCLNNNVYAVGMGVNTAGSVMVLNNNKTEFTTLGNNLDQTSNAVEAIYVNDKEIYIGSGARFLKYDSTQEHWFVVSSENKGFTPDNLRITNIIENNNALYVSTTSNTDSSFGHLYKFTNGNWYGIDKNFSSGISHMIAYNSNIYATTFYGSVIKIDKNDALTNLGQITDHFGATSLSIVDNQLYVGLMNGFVYKYKLKLN